MTVVMTVFQWIVILLAVCNVGYEVGSAIKNYDSKTKTVRIFQVIVSVIILAIAISAVYVKTI